MNYSKFKVLLLLLSSLTSVVAKRQIIFNSQSLSVSCVDTNGEENSVFSASQKPKKRPCPLPVSDLISGRSKPAIMGPHYTEPPEWLNVTLATIGQDYMRKNVVGYYYSVLLTTILVGTVNEVGRVIYCAATGITPKQAEKRFIGNILNPLYWTNGDIGPGIHHPPNTYRWNQSSLYEGLNLIRSVHDKVAQQASASKERFLVPGASREIDKVVIDDVVWDAFQKDLEASHLAPLKNKPICPNRNNVTQFPFNQFGMALQYWAHAAGPFYSPARSLFMTNPTEEELLGYLHFWSFIAHVMGTSEEYNVCLQPSIPAAKIYFEQLVQQYIVPGLFDLQYESKVLIESYIKAFMPTFPFIDVRVLVKQLAEDFVGIQTPNIQKILTPQARLYSSLLRRSRWYIKNPRNHNGFRFIINGMLQVSTMKLFGYNILVPDSFTTGLLQTNERLLDKLEIWKVWRNSTKST